MALAGAHSECLANNHSKQTLSNIAYMSGAEGGQVWCCNPTSIDPAWQTGDWALPNYPPPNVLTLSSLITSHHLQHQNSQNLLIFSTSIITVKDLLCVFQSCRIVVNYLFKYWKGK